MSVPAPWWTSEGWAARGSQLQMQLYVNCAAEALTDAVVAEVPELAQSELTWVAPLARDGFAEPRDRAFLEVVGCGHLVESLKSFWPARGPVWDGLAVDSDGSVVLVEGKSHPQEVYGGGTKAGKHSSVQIGRSLATTQRWLGIAEDPARWMAPLRPEEKGHSAVYQSANRYAHLYWLREQGISAWLVHALFVNDPTFKGTSREDWIDALPRIEEDLGLRGVVVPSATHLFLAGLDPDDVLPRSQTPRGTSAERPGSP